MVESKVFERSQDKDLKSIKKSTRDLIAAYIFMLPALLSLISFVFIPIFFSFIMSLFKNPEVSDLADRLLEFYTTYSNFNKQSIYGFFTDGEYGILADRGIYLFISALVFLLYIRFAYKKLTKISKFKSPVNVLISILTGLAITPLLIFLFNLLCRVVPLVLPIENYRVVLTQVQLDFLRILFNTVFWTVICTVSHVILGIFLAVLLNQDFKGKGLFRGLFILPWAIPSFASTVIWKNFVFHPQGFLGSRTDLIFKNGSFYFNTGNFISILVGITVIIIIFLNVKKLIDLKTNLHPSYKPFKNMIILIISVPIGILVYELVNSLIGSYGSGLLAYNIISIENTKMDSFWVSAPLTILNQNFRMITFSAILINIWLGVPFMMVSFLAAMQAIPQELYEAAEIDGANKWIQFKKITYPLLKPTLFTVSLLGFVWTFNLFNVVYLLAQNQNLPSNLDYSIFVTFIYDLFDTQHEYARAAALSFIVFLMLTIFSKSYQKIFNVDKIFISEIDENEIKKENIKQSKKSKNKRKQRKKKLKKLKTNKN